VSTTTHEYTPRHIDADGGQLYGSGAAVTGMCVESKDKPTMNVVSKSAAVPHNWSRVDDVRCMRLCARGGGSRSIWTQVVQGAICSLIFLDLGL
jgi:hypothetical protein